MSDNAAAADGGDDTDRSALLTRRELLLGGLACAVCAAAAYAAPRWADGRPASTAVTSTSTYGERRRMQPDAMFRVSTSEPLVALTFDDGPDPRYTPQVLDILKAHQAHATFFLVGVNVAAHPQLAQQIDAAGHSCANHTHTHPNLDLLSQGQVTTELDRCEGTFAAHQLPPPTFFRPPYGDTDRVVGGVASTARYQTVFWDVAVERYVNHMDGNAAVDALLKRINAGSIILAHDGGTITGTAHPIIDRSRTVRALPALLQGLARRGLRVVDVATLLDQGDLRPAQGRARRT